MSKPKHDAPQPLETADERLDEALEETFPASDPVSIDPVDPPRSPEPPHAPDKHKKRH